MLTFEFNSTKADEAFAARQGVLAYLQSDGDPSADLTAVEIAFNELVGNVKKHAPPRVHVGIAWRHDGFAIMTVSDEGPGFDITTWQPTHQLAEDGRGLSIVAALAQKVTVDAEPGAGTRVCAVLPIRRAAKT